MNFNTYFRLTSYATIAAAALALFVSGGVGPGLAAAFVIVMIVAFKLEGTGWQLSERVALGVILISLPIFYFDWRVLTPLLLNESTSNLAQRGEINSSGAVAHGNIEVAVLAHLILFLSAVKLLQRKADRDWFFLYLISFFTVLLAAGLTASPLFLATLILYLLCALSTVVAFEIQKAKKTIAATQTRLLVPPDKSLFRKLPMRLWKRKYLETRRLPLVSVGLLILIVVLALPFFLIAPRTASSALKRGGRGVSGFIGFSDNVTLGQIGELKGNDEVFMHVRLDNLGAVPPAGLRWRGVALDEFTGKSWKKSRAAERSERKDSESGFFKLGTTEDLRRLTEQTFILEPVDTPVLFGAPRIVAVQGSCRSCGSTRKARFRLGRMIRSGLLTKCFLTRPNRVRACFDRIILNTGSIQRGIWSSRPISIRASTTSRATCFARVAPQTGTTRYTHSNLICVITTATRSS